ncbi:D-glycero-beta-D-manno-heptose 1-phosphate adenylyltransferase [Microbacterium oryzae]|uniref:D-glycero-beta-D-manno-heptose 1-phosphate adenylyltransferase n=1 Tax=Microbacterium oryzae TaxID=743009 RepID=UPI0025B144A1|nr:D-glycero-beta-D-manno-heptose 1-phosphate adenylyltransferase [Microbacterium oryzae]MDN3309392.1 D-glycero-beta-D-manno-heptose 1-phosphate adenylyltransferase [Microbacterium oryzae]
MKIAVVGDTLLDEDIDGTSTRLCPDAPVPVIEVGDRSRRAGGAGLVATMLARDGHEVVLVTALSDDGRAQQLRECLAGIGVVAGPSHAPTPVKTRLRTNGLPVGRLDEGCEEPPAPEVTADMLAAIAVADAVIVADYGRRLAADETLRAALAERAAQVPLVWDPHPRGATPIAEAHLVTPNQAEATAAAGVRDADEAAAVLRERWGCMAVVVTLGDQGALLLEGDEAVRLPALPVATSDPCGAGDRFAATATTVLAEGGNRRAAVRAAIDAAGSYLAAGGVASLASREIAHLGDDRGDARAIAEAVRARGGTVVATGGCFDLVHAGHVRTLEAARALGDCLIVCLNSDDSVRRLKGPQRPIIGQQDRVELLSALACVDAVVVFDEDGPESAIEAIRPDLWIKGGDYSAESLPEARILEQWGGRALTLPYHLGRSTTALASALAKVG